MAYGSSKDLVLCELKLRAAVVEFHSPVFFHTSCNLKRVVGVNDTLCQLEAMHEHFYVSA